MTPGTIGSTRGVVLAGAHPWNNSPFERLAPRPLLRVADRPLVSYALSWLQQGGVCDAVLCTNRETRALRAQLADQIPNGMTLSYHEDPMPLGPAGCVRDASCGTSAETFVVVDGTTIPTVDLRALLSHHEASGVAATVVVHTETPRAGEPARQVPCGIYIFARQALAAVRPSGFFDIKEHLIPQLYKNGERISTHAIAGEGLRVLDVPSYLAVNEWMVQHLTEDGGGSSDHLIDRSASIASDAVLAGPVLIGPNVRVMSGATIVGPTSIGAESIVECGAVVSRSAVWRRCLIGRSVAADRTILGDDSVVPQRSRVFSAVRLGSRPDTSSEIRGLREFSSVAALFRRRLASLSSLVEG